MKHTVIVYRKADMISEGDRLQFGDSIFEVKEVRAYPPKRVLILEPGNRALPVWGTDTLPVQVPLIPLE